MLPTEVKKLLVKSVPSTISLDGSTFEIQKSFGKAPLNTIISPSINLSIVSEGKRYYRSMDDSRNQISNVITESDVRTAILQYKVGASGKQLTASDTITKTAATLYSLSKTPVVDITNINNFEKNLDYRLLDDHETLSWLAPGPALNSTYVVDYNWIEDGYWIAYGIADYLIKDILANMRPVLDPYGIDVFKVGNVVDLSAIYADEAFSACSFDVQLNYPYSWTRTLTEEEAVTLESIALDLIINGHVAGTIHVPDI